MSAHEAWIALVGVAAALGLAVALPQAAMASTAVAVLATGLLAAWIAWQDATDYTIPDGALVALAALGAAVRIGDAAAMGEGLAGALALLACDLAVAGGLLLGVREVYYRRRGHDGLGFGDVKLAAAGGVLAGLAGFAWALLAASLLGLAVVAGRRLRHPQRSWPAATDRLAFGALLAPALWAVWLPERIPHLWPA